MIEPLGDLLPVVAPTAFVHIAAVVSGDVELGEHVSIWPCAVLRGDQGPIRIGAHSNIQDGSVVHNTGGLSVTSVGERVTVGHRVILHGCTIEDDVLVGMGAIVLDNAVVGAGSVVGAAALITANTVIPPGSLVLGAPAKVVGPVSEKQRAWIAHSWTVYAQRCAEEVARQR